MLADAVQRICEIGASVGTLDSVGALLSDTRFAGMAAQVSRLNGNGETRQAIAESGTAQALAEGSGATMLGGLQDLWTMLVTRLATRGFSKWALATVEETVNGSNGTDTEKTLAMESNGSPDPDSAAQATGADATTAGDPTNPQDVVNGGAVVKADAPSQDKTLDTHANTVRLMILQLIKADFAGRVPFAVRWLTEEWTVEWRHHKLSSAAAAVSTFSASGDNADGNEKQKGTAVATPIYDKWLLALLDEIIPTLGEKDKSLTRLLSDLPSLPEGAIARIAPLCHDRTRMIVGFTALRDIAAHRPPARPRALDTLLELTRHPDDPVRKAAINTCRAWVKAATASLGDGSSSSGPETSNVGTNYKRSIEVRVMEYGRESLEVLVKVVEPPPPPVEGEKTEGDTNGTAPAAKAEATTNVVEQSGNPGDVPANEPKPEEGKEATEGDAEPEAKVPGLEAEIKTEADVQRFVELPFALCTKAPAMLALVFETYPHSPPFVQRAIEKHIYKLIKALGPGHARLLELLRNHPEGAEPLALVSFRALTETGRPAALVAIVKELASKKEVNPRWLVPIMPDLGKADILRFLPRVITLLNSGDAEDHQLVTNVFHSIVVQPPATFGHVSTNLPRVRQTELLTPVELMSLLHHLPIDWGLKCAIDAIKICFGMTDVFRSEVLGAVLNQIADEPQVPLLFMRTAIMAVSTYRSLTGWVGTNVLSGLITKKIWQTPVLWQGFIKCAQHTAPQSYGALIQLPLEQLKDVASKSPQLKQGLKEYLMQRGGGAGGARGGARMKAFAEALGIDLEAEAAAAAAAAAATTAGFRPGGAPMGQGQGM